MKSPENHPNFDNGSQKEIEERGFQTSFTDLNEQQTLSSSFGASRPKLPIYSSVRFHFLPVHESEKLETVQQQTDQLKLQDETNSPIENSRFNHVFEGGIEKSISHFFHRSLDESIKSENPYRLFSGLMPFALGALGASYSFARSTLLAAWTLLTLPLQIGPEEKETILSLVREFSLLLYGLRSQDPDLKQQALLKLYRIQVLIAQTLLKSLQKEWDEAQSTDQVLELLGKWSATGILSFSSAATEGVKLLAKPILFATKHSLRIPQRLLRGIPELEQKIQVFIQENPAAKNQLTTAAHEIASSTSTTSKAHPLKTAAPGLYGPVQQHESARIVDFTGGLKQQNLLSFASLSREEKARVIGSLTPQEWEGKVWRGVPKAVNVNGKWIYNTEETVFDWHPGIKYTEGRYHKKGAEALYTSTGERAEAWQTVMAEMREPQYDLVLHWRDLKFNKVLDLTDLSVLDKLGIKLSDLVMKSKSPDAYRVTQEIGEIAQSLGFDALKVRSAEYKKGINIVILRK
jgi:hypothetical protein